jgi:hypothetical protein
MPIPKCMLTDSQTQSRSVTLTPNGSSVSYLHIAYLVNHHRRRGLVSDVTSRSRRSLARPTTSPTALIGARGIGKTFIWLSSVVASNHDLVLTATSSVATNSSSRALTCSVGYPRSPVLVSRTPRAWLPSVRSYPRGRSSRNGCRGYLRYCEGAESARQCFPMHHLSHHRHSLRLRDPRRPDIVDRYRTRHALSYIQEHRTVRSRRRRLGLARLPPALDHIARDCCTSEQAGRRPDDERMGGTTNEDAANATFS